MVMPKKVSFGVPAPQVVHTDGTAGLSHLDSLTGSAMAAAAHDSTLPMAASTVVARGALSTPFEQQILQSHGAAAVPEAVSSDSTATADHFLDLLDGNLSTCTATPCLSNNAMILSGPGLKLEELDPSGPAPPPLKLTSCFVPVDRRSTRFQGVSESFPRVADARKSEQPAKCVPMPNNSCISSHQTPTGPAVRSPAISLCGAPRFGKPSTIGVRPTPDHPVAEHANAKPAMSLGTYTGPCISQSNPDGPHNAINPARALMITATTSFTPASKPESFGPLKSGMNTLPLGRSRPMGGTNASATTGSTTSTAYANAPQSGSQRRPLSQTQLIRDASGTYAFSLQPALASHQARNVRVLSSNDSVVLRSGTRLDRTSFNTGAPATAAANNLAVASVGNTSRRQHGRALGDVQKRALFHDLMRQIDDAVQAAQQNSTMDPQKCQRNVHAALQSLRPLFGGAAALACLRPLP